MLVPKPNEKFERIRNVRALYPKNEKPNTKDTTVAEAAAATTAAK